MAITIIKQPNKIMWSRNPIVFEFETNNRFSNPGAYYIGELIFYSGAVEGKTIELGWNEKKYLFVFKNVPNDSGLELPAFQPGESNNEFVVRVYQALLNFYPIIDAYNLELDENKIKFTSKIKKAIYQLSKTPNEDYTDVNLLSLQDAVNPVMNENFALYVEIHIQDEFGKYELFNRSVLDFADDDLATWDIQEYITSAMLMDGIALPNLDHPEILKESSSIRKFFLRFAEMYGHPQTMMILNNSQEFTAVLGGFDTPYRSKGLLPNFLIDENINKWICNCSISLIMNNQKSYASIINLHKTYSNVELKARMYYSNGSIITKNIISIGTWNLNEKLVIPIGIEDINKFIAEDIGMPDFMEFWIEMEGSLLSNLYKVHVTHEYYPFFNHFIFQNSLGCIDSLFSYGKSEKGYEIEKSDNAFVPNIEPGVLDSSLRELDIELRDYLKINSGYFDKKNIVKFRDLFLSSYKFMLYKGKYQPIVLETNNIKEFDDGNNLHAISFAVKLANEQTLWTE